MAEPCVVQPHCRNKTILSSKEFPFHFEICDKVRNGKNDYHKLEYLCSSCPRIKEGSVSGQRFRLGKGGRIMGNKECSFSLDIKLIAPDVVDLNVIQHSERPRRKDHLVEARE